MSATIIGHRPTWGLAAFFAGVIALIVVTLHVSGVFVEQEKSAATAIGEFAAEIRDSAKRALSNDPAPTQELTAEAWDVETYFQILVPLFAGVSLVLGAISLFRREAPTLPSIAIAMGCSAFVMQYVFWLALLIGGICLLVVIINNIGDILGA